MTHLISDYACFLKSSSLEARQMLSTSLDGLLKANHVSLKELIFLYVHMLSSSPYESGSVLSLCIQNPQ